MADGDKGRPRSIPASLHERDLSLLWAGGNLPPQAIVTLDGTPFQVVYRGRPNAGSGPDFRDAVLALPDGRLLHGDVELHLRASDFVRHGHHRDPAYDRVILHLVYHADDGAATALYGGRSAPVVALERWLAARTAELERMLQQPALWREPCQGAVERMGPRAVVETLGRLGERRLRIKGSALGRRAPAAVLYDALLHTLGYGPQRPAWVDLARRVGPRAIEQRTVAEAPRARALESLLLGAAGLLPREGVAETEAGVAWLAESWRLWRSQGAPISARIPASAQRPANHPARRLAGLARLLEGGVAALLVRLQEILLSSAERPAAQARALVAELTVAADGPWQERLLPWGPAAATPIGSLIGPGKALELALNAALPVLLALAERDERWSLASAVLAVFHALPSPPAYGRTIHLVRALQADGRSLIRRADQSQGALHLYAQYCTQGGCGRCPLS